MKRLLQVVVMVFVVAGLVPILQASPQNEVYAEFYSDNTFSQIVGAKYRGCTGSSQWGVATEWVLRETTSCASSFYVCQLLHCTVSYNSGTGVWQENCELLDDCF